VFLTDDNYFLYESDEIPISWEQQPVVKLLSKRQAPDQKESKDLGKKPLFIKTNSNPENSSNQKSNFSPAAEIPQRNSKLFSCIYYQLLKLSYNFNLVSESQNETDTTTIPITTSTASPLTSTQAEVLPTVDYNGENITVKNITQDHHRYYNR
jgi:hypothetical protein